MSQQIDELAAIVYGAQHDLKEIKERAYWEVFQNLRYIYGPLAFKTDSFEDFKQWLDSLFEPTKGDME